MSEDGLVLIFGVLLVLFILWLPLGGAAFIFGMINLTADRVEYEAMRGCGYVPICTNSTWTETQLNGNIITQFHHSCTEKLVCYEPQGDR